jgi:hypothetical protein
MTWAAAGVVLVALAGQAFWITYVLSGVKDEIRDLKSDLGARLDRIETTFLHDYGEHITRLEERTRG